MRDLNSIRKESEEESLRYGYIPKNILVFGLISIPKGWKVKLSQWNLNSVQKVSKQTHAILRTTNSSSFRFTTWNVECCTDDLCNISYHTLYIFGKLILLTIGIGCLGCSLMLMAWGEILYLLSAIFKCVASKSGFNLINSCLRLVVPATVHGNTVTGGWLRHQYEVAGTYLLLSFFPLLPEVWEYSVDMN